MREWASTLIGCRMSAWYPMWWSGRAEAKRGLLTPARDSWLRPATGAHHRSGVVRYDRRGLRQHEASRSAGAQAIRPTTAASSTETGERRRTAPTRTPGPSTRALLGFSIAGIHQPAAEQQSRGDRPRKLIRSQRPGSEQDRARWDEYDQSGDLGKRPIQYESRRFGGETTGADDAPSGNQRGAEAGNRAKATRGACRKGGGSYRDQYVRSELPPLVGQEDVLDASRTAWRSPLAQNDPDDPREAAGDSAQTTQSGVAPVHARTVRLRNMAVQPQHRTAGPRRRMRAGRA